MKCKGLKRVICIGLAAMSIASVCSVSAFADGFEHPSWAGVDENGNKLMGVVHEDGTYEELPTWYEAYAALDYDSAPDEVKEVITIARRCLTLEKMGYSPYELYADYMPDLHNPGMPQ